MGRDRSGEQAFARHVEGAWGEGGRRQWGVFALDGQGDWRGAYVMVRALDGRVWSRTPNRGWRMGVWVTQQGARLARYLRRRNARGHLLNKKPFVARGDGVGNREGLKYLGTRRIEPQRTRNSVWPTRATLRTAWF